ncbi:MAG TPA: hypothetical protein VK760_02350 [Candidatus Acidoferrales bacterium]|nr:hypothetical protein [Candidatus Acidoferrales bacterium]
MVAFAISIAIHEVAAGLIARPGAPAPVRETIAHVTTARIVPPPAPTPRPTPKPTPPPKTPPPLTFTHAPIVVARAAPRAAIRRNAAAPPLLPVANAADASAAPSPGSAEGTGAGDATGAGSPGDGGTGTGGGADEPCGGVTFISHGARVDPSTNAYFVTIRMSVSFPDGHAESTILDYPFYYPNAAANPFTPQNRNNPDVGVLMQTPPPALAPGEPPLVQYVVKHTAADGFTLMAPCPGAAPH